MITRWFNRENKKYLEPKVFSNFKFLLNCSEINFTKFLWKVKAALSLTIELCMKFKKIPAIYEVKTVF